MTDRTASTSVPIHPLLAGRWSPRAFDASHQLGDDELTALLEAARWAPSSANTQPWRFAVCRRGTPEHAAVVECLTGNNREWAPAASALLVVAATTLGGDGRPRRWADHDTGQAVAHLTVQAASLGLVVHQMGGYEADRLAAMLSADVDVHPVTVVAVGRHDPSAPLPERLAEREVAPRARKPLEELRLGLDPALLPAAD
jgi:nitroreductase